MFLAAYTYNFFVHGTTAHLVKFDQNVLFVKWEQPKSQDGTWQTLLKYSVWENC
jgi:hypothetical protein